MENEFLWIQINDNGTLTIHEKNHHDIYENLAYFEDGADAGDTYDYSPPPTDKIITSLGKKAKITLEEAGPLLARFRIVVKMKLPRRLTSDRQSRSSKTRKIDIISFVELAANAGHVEVTTVVNNAVKDHRLRVIFPSCIDTDHSFAGMPFDIAQFPIEEANDVDLPDDMQDLMLAGRYTVPMRTRPFQNFISLANDQRSLSIFSRGLSEYEIIPGQNSIALTLLRGVGWLARPDLQTREGDVGPHIFTPEAQCLGKHVFGYAIYPHGSNLTEANPHFESDRHVLKFRALQTNAHPGRLPNQFSFFSWQHDEVFGALKLTALKQSEDGRDLIIRFYNALNKTVSSTLKIGGTVLAAWRTNLNEENQEEMPLEDGLVPISVRGREIMTVRVRLQPAPVIEDFKRDPARVLPSITPTAEINSEKLPRLVTTKEVAAEQERAQQLGSALQAVRSEAYILQSDIESRSDPTTAQLALLQRMKGREATLARQYYEAQISALLNQQLLVTRQMENSLNEIGESLNWARIRKRVGEFLIHYYEGLLEKES